MPSAATLRLVRPVLILATLWLPSAAFAQQAEKTLPAEAAERLRHIVGDWQNRWEIPGDDGEVVRVMEGSMHAEYLLGDRVVETTTTTASGVSKGWVFYNFREERFYHVSVGNDGDLWTFAGGLDAFVITSLPKVLPDGREVVMRFTHENIQEDSFEALQEVSFDGGATWSQGPREFVTRVKNESDTPN